MPTLIWITLLFFYPLYNLDFMKNALQCLLATCPGHLRTSCVATGVNAPSHARFCGPNLWQDMHGLCPLQLLNATVAESAFPFLPPVEGAATSLVSNGETMLIQHSFNSHAPNHNALRRSFQDVASTSPRVPTSAQKTLKPSWHPSVFAAFP